MSAADRLANQLLQTAQRLARVQSYRLLRERRVALRSKQKERQELLRRRLVFGRFVEKAGLGNWPFVEVLGVLIEAKDRVGRSPTMRLAARKRGEQLLRSETPWLANYQPDPPPISPTNHSDDQSDTPTEPQASEQVSLATPSLE